MWIAISQFSSNSGDPWVTLAQAILAMPPDGDPSGRRRRSDEVRETGRRLVRNLTRTPFRNFSGLPEGAVLKPVS